jgi:hypothetical protein
MIKPDCLDRERMVSPQRKQRPQAVRKTQGKIHRWFRFEKAARGQFREVPDECHQPKRDLPGIDAGDADEREGALVVSQLT